jgi:hypothetical protein
VPTSIAQNASRHEIGAEKDPGRATERLIISVPPQQKTRIHNLLSKAAGQANGKKLGSSQFEVWTIPKSQEKHIVRQLRQLGSTVMRLSDDWNHILHLQQGPVEMSAAHDAFIKNARASPGFVEIAMMEAPHAAIAEYALTIGADLPAPAGASPPEKTVSRIVIPITHAQRVIVQRVRAHTTAKGTTWHGTIEETGENALLMWWNDGRLSGVFAYKGHIFTIENIGGHVHAVVETDPKKMPPDHAPMTSNHPLARDHHVADQREVPPPPPTDIKPFSDAEREALEATKVTIDMMILYTLKAASRYIHGPADLIELAVEQANETFRNSGIGNVSLRLVHTQLLSYDETGATHFDHLYRMVDGVGIFKDVRHLRDEKRADIVGLILDDPSGCGLSTRVGADAEEAYFVVHHSCAALTISIAHEIGHILGARHDRSSDRNTSPFPYGHGHVNGSKWRDVMSLHKACAGCPRIPFWSNPRIKYQGEPTGTLAEDSARVVLEQAERVSKFR